MDLDEEELIGEPLDEVPAQESTDDECRGRRTKKQDGEKVFAGYCRATPGRGTEHLGEGRCQHHGGSGGSGGEREGAGAPEGNGNAQKHALHADRGLLYERLSDGRQQLVDEWEAALIERYKEYHGRDPDRADVEDIFELAVGYAQRRIARAWLAENADDELDLLTEEMVVGQRENGTPVTVEVPSKMLDAIGDNRREDRLTRKHKGLEKDPQTKQAEETGRLADALLENLKSAYSRDSLEGADVEE